MQLQSLVRIRHGCHGPPESIFGFIDTLHYVLGSIYLFSVWFDSNDSGSTFREFGNQPVPEADHTTPRSYTDLNAAAYKSHTIMFNFCIETFYMSLASSSIRVFPN